MVCHRSSAKSWPAYRLWNSGKIQRIVIKHSIVTANDTIYTRVRCGQMARGWIVRCSPQKACSTRVSWFQRQSRPCPHTAVAKPQRSQSEGDIRSKRTKSLKGDKPVCSVAELHQGQARIEVPSCKLINLPAVPSLPEVSQPLPASLS